MGREPRELKGRTASGVVLQPVLSYARSLGVDVASLMREAGIDGSKVGDPDYRVPESARGLLWRELPRLTNDPFFGLHVPQHARIGALDVIDYALCYSDNVRDALTRFVRFSRILSDALDFDVTARDGATRFERLVFSMPPHEQDAVFCMLCVRSREISNTEIRPREVTFIHRKPSSVSEYESIFLCPVRFGAPSCAIAFEDADLALPVRDAKPGLVTVLERHARDLLARLPRERTYTARIRHVVVRALANGTPTLGVIARAMHASPRTVQRRLKDEGTSHREVVDDVRRELATRYLADPALSITEVAFLLGFADSSSFRRAYRGWTGTSPRRAARR